MCSIVGGTWFGPAAESIWERARDRGRDHDGMHCLDTGQWIGNHRAIPTTEAQYPTEDQPVGEGPWIVFNGIISNDADLGLNPGEADTSVLPRVLDLSSIEAFRDSLVERIVGSYAIAVLFPDGQIWLACNYKPIWIAEHVSALYFSSLRHHLPDGGFRAYRFPPYSVGRLGAPPSEILSIPRTQAEPALTICSSGLDSTSAAAYAATRHASVRLLHFDYGCQATAAELERLTQIAEYLDCESEVLQIPPALLGNASPLLCEGADIAGGVAGTEYAHEWVPARNLMMLSMTVAYAEAHGFGTIYLGTNLEESSAFCDNEEQFILDFNNCLWGAVQNGVKVEVIAPLGGLMKHEIVPFGRKYGAPLHLTWSCYRGGERHCGACGPCFMRKTAFQRNGFKDPAFRHEWDDPFWEGCAEWDVPGSAPAGMRRTK